MWLAVVAVVLGAGAGGLAGRLAATTTGRLGRALHDRLTGAPEDPTASWRGPALGAGGLVLLGLGSRWIPGAPGLVVEAAGYALATAFAVLNWPRTGMVLVAAGLAANLLVIGLDGGMPVAALPAGQSVPAHHHGLGPGDRLTFLADDVTTPLVPERISAGDLLVGLGGAVVAFSWVVPAAARPRRRSGAAPARLR